MTYTPIQTAIQKAIDAAGSQQKLGDIVGVKQQTVRYWLFGSKRIPAIHIITIEKGTGVSRHELDPVVYPKEAA